MTLRERDTPEWIPDKHLYIGEMDCAVAGCNRKREFPHNDDDPHCIFHLDYWEEVADAST